MKNSNTERRYSRWSSAHPLAFVAASTAGIVVVGQNRLLGAVSRFCAPDWRDWEVGAIHQPSGSEPRLVQRGASFSEEG